MHALLSDDASGATGRALFVSHLVQAFESQSKPAAVDNHIHITFT